MKILWVKTDFLHPTDRGGQIRTLGILRHLSRRHEIHYVALDDGTNPEGVRRSLEYCSKSYPIPHRLTSKWSPGFVWQLLRSTASPTPFVVDRYRSDAMRRSIDRLLKETRFDSIICDFLTPAANISDLGSCILFQHNLETMIWRRTAENSVNPLSRAFFRHQEKCMFRYEGRVCNSVRRIIAVSDQDAEMMCKMFGLKDVAYVPTGVDLEYFARPTDVIKTSDLVFLGSMDWAPNIDGMRFFTQRVLPGIRRSLPECSVAIVGRRPAPEIVAMGTHNAAITVTGTVSDVRPYLWGSAVSIVPLRIGGGTRLKIFESMAAGVPVVSTTIGAEGLDVSSPENIRLADEPEEFAEHCVELLSSPVERKRMSAAAWELVNSRFSWERVTDQFERVIC